MAISTTPILTVKSSNNYSHYQVTWVTSQDKQFIASVPKYCQPLIEIHVPNKNGIKLLFKRDFRSQW